MRARKRGGGGGQPQQNEAHKGKRRLKKEGVQQTPTGYERKNEVDTTRETKERKQTYKQTNKQNQTRGGGRTPFFFPPYFFPTNPTTTTTTTTTGHYSIFYRQTYRPDSLNKCPCPGGTDSALLHTAQATERHTHTTPTHTHSTQTRSSAQLCQRSSMTTQKQIGRGRRIRTCTVSPTTSSKQQATTTQENNEEPSRRHTATDPQPHQSVASFAQMRQKTHTQPRSKTNESLLPHTPPSPEAVSPPDPAPPTKKRSRLFHSPLAHTHSV